VAQGVHTHSVGPCLGRALVDDVLDGPHVQGFPERAHKQGIMARVWPDVQPRPQNSTCLAVQWDPSLIPPFADNMQPPHCIRLSADSPGWLHTILREPRNLGEADACL
jgi:hypothetical protein